jgi:uncharacterized membrane protein YhfC
MSLFIGMAVFAVCYVIALATQYLFALVIANQLLLIFVLCLRAGLVEESARFLAFKVFLRKKTAPGDALMYGVGHGGIEVLLVFTLAMLSNLMFAIMINAGMLDILIATAPEQASVLENAVSLLSTTTPLLLSMGFFERISAMILHISLSMVVFYAARRRKPLFLVLAILLHTLANSTLLLLQLGWISVEIFELLLFVVSLGYAVIAFFLTRHYIATDKAAAQPPTVPPAPPMPPMPPVPPAPPTPPAQPPAPPAPTPQSL